MYCAEIFFLDELIEERREILAKYPKSDGKLYNNNSYCYNWFEYHCIEELENKYYEKDILSYSRKVEKYNKKLDNYKRNLEKYYKKLCKDKIVCLEKE